MELETSFSSYCDMKFMDTIFPAFYSQYFVSLEVDVLPFHSLCRCISQDLHFLKAFDKGLEIAQNHVDKELLILAINNLRNSVHQYIGARIETIGEVGESIADGSTTEEYTHSLLSKVCGKAKDELIATCVVAFIAPCVRLYEYIHTTVACDTGHSFNRWFDVYSLETAKLEVDNTLDEFTSSLTREDIAEVEDVYHDALMLAVEFFTSLPASNNSLVPFCRLLDRCQLELTICCNFDLTCSKDGSVSSLEEVATSNIAEEEFDKVFVKWQHRASQYRKDELECMSNMKNGIPAQTFNYENLHNALEQYAAFERHENTRIVSSQLLKGLCLEEIKRVGQDSLLRGCKRFFQKVVENERPKTNVHIVSYCWCSELIRSAFPSELNVHIHSNELVFEDSTTTGEIIRKVESPMEKKEYFDSVKARYPGDNQFTIYIGRRAGDLLCLLEANIGIVSEPGFLTPLCEHFGIELKPLHPSVIDNQKRLSQGLPFSWKPLSGILYFVDSWAEIEAFIFGS